MALLSKIQSRQSKYKEANDAYNVDFVMNGYPSVKIINEESAETMTASVVSKQESDEAYIYTAKKKPLTVGDVWCAKGLYWLISEEIVIIKEVTWHKYHAYLCNVEVDNKHAFFYGPGKSRISVNLKQNTFLMSSQSPVLVVGGTPLEYRDKFLIKERAWSVEEYDNISTEGITYYTLAQTTISKDTKKESLSSLSPYDNIDGNQDEELRESGEILENQAIYSIPMTSITLSNFKSFDDSTKVIIVSRSKSNITFKIKPNVEELIVTLEIPYVTQWGYTATKQEVKKYTTIRKDD